MCDLAIWKPWQRMRKTSTPPTVTRCFAKHLKTRVGPTLQRPFERLHPGVPGRSGRAGGLAFTQSFEVDGQRLFLRVWRTSVLLLGDHVAHHPPKTHEEESQDVGQHPLWAELGVGGPEHRHTKSPSQIKTPDPKINIFKVIGEREPSTFQIWFQK